MAQTSNLNCSLDSMRIAPSPVCVVPPGTHGAPAPHAAPWLTNQYVRSILVSCSLKEDLCPIHNRAAPAAVGGSLPHLHQLHDLLQWNLLILYLSPAPIARIAVVADTKKRVPATIPLQSGPSPATVLPTIAGGPPRKGHKCHAVQIQKLFRRYEWCAAQPMALLSTAPKRGSRVRESTAPPAGHSILVSGRKLGLQ